jgi:hypothetical protein
VASPVVLAQATVLRDNNAYMAGAAQTAARLAPEAALADKLVVRPGVEIRASGDLALGADWALPDAAQRAGSAPMVLTLRAAGDLKLSHTLSDGFGGSAPAGLAQAGTAASFRLVAGADLSAAHPLAVVATPAAGGDLVVGRAGSNPSGPGADVLLRTTTGSIALAAAGNVQLLNNSVRIYTSGAPLAAASLPGFSRLGLLSNQTLRNADGSPLGPFFDHAGDIHIQAGRDVIGSPTPQYVTDWWWRQTNLASPGAPVAWWLRYDQFRQGIASFGGGNLRIEAGRDIVDLEASTPASGYAVRAATASDGTVLPAASLLLPGGTLEVLAGGDLVSGLLYGGGASTRVLAEGAIRPAALTGLGRSHPGLQLFYGSGQTQLRAGGNLVLGSLVSPGLLQGVVQASGGARTDLIAGLDDGARLEATSLSGSLQFTGNRTALPSSDPRGVASEVTRQVPGELRLAAPTGSLGISAPLLQRPAGPAASLQLLAGDTLSVGNITVAALSAPEGPRPQARLTGVQALTQNWRLTAEATPGLDRSAREPLALVARAGDLQLQADVRSVRPLLLVAGGSIEGRGSASLTVQHQAEGELSLLRAGADVTMADNSAARLRLAGPGDLLILAGGDVDLQRSAGLFSVGNQDLSRLLPEGGARITVVSGVDWGAADYQAALDGGLQLRGAGVGLQPYTAELWAALQAAEQGQPVPAAGSAALASAAAGWAALDPAERSRQVQTLAGEDRLQALRIEALQRLTGNPASDAATALAAYAALDPERRAEVDAGVQALALAQALAARVPTLDLAAYTASLYRSSSAERRALQLHDVLFAELRAAGRQAARLPSGSAREAAYAPGYAALALLYPGDAASRPGGDIRLSASQIKSQQGGSIRLLAPGGGVDAGALVGDAGKPPSELGITTTSGGNIEAAAGGNFAVNQSRVFTLARGDLLLWSSEGNIDAGRGAKTVTGAPPPVVTIDRDGNVVVDASGSFSGSGIAVLNEASTLDLYAPRGEISAGEAGIASRGTAFLGAQLVRGDDISVGAGSIGAPPAADTGGATAGLAVVSASAATAAGPGAQGQEDDEDERRKRKPRRNLLLEFLGFGNPP